MYSRRASLLVFLTISLTLAPLSAAERVIAINFSGGSTDAPFTPVGPSEIAGVVAKANWNNCQQAKGTQSALNDDSGAATSASVAWDSNNTWSLGLAAANGNARMMNGYLDTTNESTTTVSVSKLPAGFAKAGYDVYVYCDGKNSQNAETNTRSAKYSIGNASQIATDESKTDFSGSFTESVNGGSGNVLRFGGLTATEFTLMATPEKVAGICRAPINAIQIVSPGRGTAKAVAGAWLSRDINAIPGSTTFLEPDGYQIKAAGKDMWDQQDGIRFVYQVCSGDFDIRTRVASIERTNEWAKAGLMIRQSLSDGSIHCSLVATPEHGCNIQRRMEAGAESLTAETGPAPMPNCWLRLKRSGITVIYYRSSDGENWEKIGQTELTFSNPVLAGFCVTSHEPDRLTTAVFRDFSLKRSTAGSDPTILADVPAVSDRLKKVAPPTARAGAVDPTLAAALASAAAKLAAENKNEKAKDMCFKALTYDESCAEALYELGKQLEKEGNMAFGAEVLARASRELAKLQGGNPTMGVKRQDADRRLLKLNPYAQRLTEIFTDYADSLSAIIKKSTDTLTQEAAGERMRQLTLADYVAPEKLPKIEKAVAASAVSGGNNVSPEIERALKATGWSKITGNWKKKAENIYEVTNGKLEATMTNGLMQVTVHKGGTGSVKVMVRNNHNDNYFSSYYSYGSGYGVRIEGKACKLYTPLNFTGMIYRPYVEREVSVELTKSQVLISAMEGNLEITVNGHREHRSNYKINKDGPFAVEIEGTMTIESPGAKGQ